MPARPQAARPRPRRRSSTAIREAALPKRSRSTAGPRNGAAIHQILGGSPRLGEPQPSIVSPAPVAEDIGDIAVIQDTGDLVLPHNPFDVRSTGLRFTRSGSSYTLSKIDGAFRSELGTRVTLATTTAPR